MTARSTDLRRRGLVTDSAWATGAEVTTLVASLVVFYLVTTRLGPAAYGYYVGAQSLVATLAMLSSVWVGLLLLQEVVREERAAEQVFPACLTLVLTTGVLAVGLALALGQVLLPRLALGTLLLFAVAELLGAGFVTVTAALLQARDDYRSSVLLRTGLTVVRLVAVLGLVLLDAVTLPNLASAYCATSVLAGVLALVLARQRYRVPLRPRRPTAASVRAGSSYAGAMVSFALQEDADKLLLVRLADPAVAGLYGAAYRAVQLSLVPLRAVLGASHRRFLEHDPQKRGEHLGRAVRFTRLAGAYGAAATIALVVMAQAVPIALGDEYAGSVQMIWILAPLVLLRSLSLFAYNGLMGLGRNGTRLAIIATAGSLNIVLNVMLIQLFSWPGAAAATLAAELFFVAAAWGALVRHQHRHDAGVRVDGSGEAPEQVR